MKGARILPVLLKEIEKYPGVQWETQMGGRHNKLILRFNGSSRVHIYSRSLVDYRAGKNSVATLRRLLHELGAERST